MHKTHNPMSRRKASVIFVLAVVWLGLVAGQGGEPAIPHGTGDWPVNGLGNIRARLSVAQKAEAVWAHVPWRRRDAQPEAKDTILVDATTGLRVANVIRVNLARGAGDLLFQPPTAPGEYYLYYLPFRTAGEWYFPSTLYLAPTNTADPDWSKACAAAVECIRQGRPAEVPEARVLEIQSINDFHRFDPMETTSTPEELQAFLGRHGRQPFLLFPEDRAHPIRMASEPPLRWVETGPGRPYSGAARRGEFHSFQVGLYAVGASLEEVTAAWTSLAGEGGAQIPAAAMRCFNLAGTNWLGRPIRKTVNVPRGKIQALWFGIDVPAEAPAQIYQGALTIAAKGIAPQTVGLRLTVSPERMADAGDGDPQRQSRLRWLDSTIGLDDEVFPPYTPVAVRERTVSVLGRRLRFNGQGLPESIVSTFSRNVDAVDAPERELLAAPMELILDTASGPLEQRGSGFRIRQPGGGVVAWEAESTAGPLRVECRARLECDGYVNYQLAVRAGEAARLTDIRLVIPLRREPAVYMMGLGRKGGYRPASWRWQWDAARANNQLWIGDINAGLSCKLKHVEDRWDLANLKESGPYRDWSRDGLGGCHVDEEGDRVVIRAYAGPRQLAAGEVLHFNFGLLITPVKMLDRDHWGWRYFHREKASPIAGIAGTGPSIINLHQGDPLNPFINYPFLATDRLAAYTREAHARQMKVKLYYTIRELSDFTAEFWALRSLGSEVFLDGPGFHLADHFQPGQPGQALPKTGDSWLCEHVVDGYTPAWHTPLGNGRIDAAIATTGLSRWHNYYLEGLSWLIRNVGIDGLYLDGVGYDREIMKRVRKVMQRSRAGCLIDFHSGNNYHPAYGLNNCANQYLELFPYVDSLWFGEGFDYNEPPDYWLVEMAGIPYGLFGEMLQGGGNPWRGMLFGMSSRLGWGGDPRSLWKLWDEFGIGEARMRGFWDPQCPAQTGRADVPATAYVKRGQTLVSIASWATNAVRIRLALDAAALGLDPARLGLYAPAVRGFQPEARFRAGGEIPVAPGRGWLLLVDEQSHPVAGNSNALPGLSAGGPLLLEENFAGGKWPPGWGIFASQRDGTRLAPTQGELTIQAAANSAAYAEHALAPGTALVACTLEMRTDQGASWGPGVALVWPGGKTLRINQRVEGRFGVDDGRRQFLEGWADAGGRCQLMVGLDAKEIVLGAQPEGGSWQEIARLPRGEFPGEPVGVRVGKMSPGGANEDFSTPGPAGVCAIRQLQVKGRR